MGETKAKKVTTHQAKTHLSRLLKEVEAGDEVVIMNGQRPVAKLVPIEPVLKKRELGKYAGLIWIADDFDAPMSPEELALWHGPEGEFD